MSPTSRPLAYVHSRTAVLRNENIDTDRIIPARFLTTTERTGLGRHCFEDWRYAADGSDDPAFPLNQPQARGCGILVAGRNFGCGSSREHAPWALTGFGFQAVISTSFADIFRNNALKNGLLPIVVDAATHQMLFDLLEEMPQAEVSIDLATQTVTLPTGAQLTFPIDGFSKACLLKGTDELGYLLSFEDRIAAFEANRA